MIEGDLREQWWSGNRIKNVTRSIEKMRWTEVEIELVPEIELRREIQLVLERSNWVAKQLLWGKATPIDKQLWSNWVKRRFKDRKLLKAVTKRQVQLML
jgi:hypothetical protein